MSTNGTNGAAFGNSSAKQQANEPLITIAAQYIKDLSFENPSAYNGLQSLTKQPNCDLSIDVGYHAIDTKTFEVVINVETKVTADDKCMFLMELKYAGVFEIAVEKLDQAQLELCLMVRCPDILFPYVRRIIFDLSRDGNYPPLNLSIIDFYSLYLKKKEQEEDELNEVKTH